MMFNSKDGSVTTSKIEILDTWKNYFAKLLNLSSQQEQREKYIHAAKANQGPPLLEETR